MLKKTILGICGAVLLMGSPLNVHAMESGTIVTENMSKAVVNACDGEEVVTVDISDWVYQAGGWGVPKCDGIDVLCTIQNIEQLEADILVALKNEEYRLDVSSYNIALDDNGIVSQLFTDILNQNVELFYVIPSMGYLSDGEKMKYIYFYYEDYSDEWKEKFVNKLKKAKSLVTDDMSEMDKALVLHDYLVQNCAYAYQEYLDGTLSNCGKDVYSAYGALVEGNAVCQGYAVGYQALLKTVGIESQIVVSDGMFHAWNLVKIDGEWYHVDATWDDPVWNREGKTEHYYFMLSDAEMLNRGHYDWETSICTSTKYDAFDYWWIYIDSQIVFENGKMYYLKDKEQGFQLIERSGETVSVKYDNDCRWEVWGDESSYYRGACSYLSKQGDYIYFNDKENLYTMNLTDFEPQLIYTYDGGDGYIFGAMVYEDGYTRLSIAENVNQSTDDYVEVSLKSPKPSVVADYEAGTLSTTTAMEFSVDDGATWTRCTDNMKINSFSWGNKDKLSIWFRTAATNGLFASDAIVVEPTAFKDVEVNSYYEVPVQWAVAKEITNGHGSETTFCPNVVCTRGQVVTFLWRAAGCPEPASLNNPFTDVAADAYYYKAVLWAVEQGITNGYGSANTFWPDGECTRGQVATFLWRAEGKPANSGSNPFIDLDETAYYYDAVLWAVEKGVTNGYGSEDTFCPDENCNRAQIVTFLYRGMK